MEHTGVQPGGSLTEHGMGGDRYPRRTVHTGKAEGAGSRTRYQRRQANPNQGADIHQDGV